jgi:hypothetical protein
MRIVIIQYSSPSIWRNFVRALGRSLILTAACVAAIAPIAQSALAADPEIALTLKDHKFEPAEIKVPSGVRIKLIIENKDSSAEEFDSFALNREKVIFPNSKGIVYVGPLKPGRYEFIGEFNRESAHGALIAQ